MKKDKENGTFITPVGGIISAANMRFSDPLKMIGTIPSVKRIIITYKQARIFPIVVILSSFDFETKHQLPEHNVIFLESGEDNPNLELIESAKLGLKYLQDKCERVFFTPVNIPMVLPETIKKMEKIDGKVIIPSYKNKSGHPILLDASVIPEILSYQGTDGLCGALRELSVPRTWVNVDDIGVITHVRDDMMVKKQLPLHNQAILRIINKLDIGRENIFLNYRLKLLLFLIADTANMRKACDAMAISYAKAWKMINQLETELGYPVVERRQGGRNGGTTRLTDRGLILLKAYQQFEDETNLVIREKFDSIFVKTDIIKELTPTDNI